MSSSNSLAERFAQYESRIYLWLGLLATIGAIAVIWGVRFPPLQDFAYHLVRIHMLVNFGEEKYGLAERATYSLFPTPYILADYLSLVFAKFFPLLETGKLVLSVYIALTVAGVLYLGRSVHGADSPFALFGLLLVFNYFFNMGLISFVLSIPFFLFAFGYWWRYRRHFSPYRLLILAALIGCVYLSHPFSFCFLFVVLACLSLYFRRDTPGIFFGLFAFLPSVLLLAIALMRDLPSSEVSRYVAFFMRDPGDKLSRAFGDMLPYFTSYQPGYETLLLAIAAFMILFALVAQVFASPREKDRGGIVLAASLLFAIYLFLPDDLLLPNLSLVANRALVFFAFMVVVLPRAPSRPVYRIGVASVAAVLVAAQFGLMYSSYRKVNGVYDDVHAAIEAVPDNERLAFWSNWEMSRYGYIYPIAHFNGYYYFEGAGAEIPALTAFAGPLRAVQFKDQSNRSRTPEDILVEGCRVAKKGGSVVFVAKRGAPPDVPHPEEFSCALRLTLGPVALYRRGPGSGRETSAPDPFSDRIYYKEGYPEEEYSYLLFYGPSRDAETLTAGGCYKPVFSSRDAYLFKRVPDCH